MNDGPGAFVVLGIGMLVIGGILLLYGQMELLQAQDCTGFFCSSNEEAMRQWTLVRLGGLVTGAIGAVVTFAGVARE